MVIIDTSVWVPALGPQQSPEKAEVARLVLSQEAATVGIILAEVLRGARSEDDFTELADQLQAAVLLDDDVESWLLAARLLFDLRRQGQTIPLPDAVIAAHALRGGHEVYTTDAHFERVPGLQLHQVGS